MLGSIEHLGSKYSCDVNIKEAEEKELSSFV